MILKSFASYLLTLNSVTASVDTRVFQTLAPKDVDTPYINLQQISEVTRYTHSGDANLNTARVQVSVFGSTLKEADEVSIDIHNAISGFKGTMAGTTVSAVFREDKLNEFESDPEIHHSRQDYFITYKE